MVIAINARMLFYGKLDGIGRLSYEVIRRLAILRPDDKIYCIYDRKHAKYYDFGPNVQHVVLPPQARHPVLWLAWFEYAIPRTLKQFKADCFLSLDGYNTLSNKVPTIIFGHDIAPLHFPDHMKWIHRKYYQRYLPKFLHAASAIVANSHFTKRDMVETLDVDAEKIHIAYSGRNEYFRPLSLEEQSAVRKRYTEGAPYFIFTGTRSPRKNLSRLIGAFNIFKSEGTNHRLLIVGRPGWKNQSVLDAYETSPYKKDIQMLEDIADEALAQLVASASAAFFVSLYEGFGLPIIEAMAAHVPVVTSNVSAMPEVAGDAALLVDPYDVDAIAEAMNQIICDKVLRKELIEKGAQQYLKYNWDDQANKVHELINDLIPNA